MGTLILFADRIIMILLHERSRAFLGGRMLARLALTGALVLSFDQVAFYAGLRYLTGAPLAVLFGGWIAKMARCAGANARPPGGCTSARLPTILLFQKHIALSEDYYPSSYHIPKRTDHGLKQLAA